MTQRKSIYLCGRINGCTDRECKKWRKKAKRLLSNHNCIDPMDRDYRGRESVYEYEIIEKDKENIDNSEIILVWIDRPSFGTAMEIMYAHMNGQTILAVNNIGDALSPWVAYHATAMFNTLEDACEKINGGAF
jgi:hypothetical protein